MTLPSVLRYSFNYLLKRVSCQCLEKDVVVTVSLSDFTERERAGMGMREGGRGGERRREGREPRLGG